MVATDSAQTVHLKWNVGAGVGFQASKLKCKIKFRSGCRCESGEVKMAPGMESQASHFKWKIAYRADAQNFLLNNKSWFYESLFLGESVGVHEFICIRQSTLSIFGNQLIDFSFFCWNSRLRWLRRSEMSRGGEDENEQSYSEHTEKSLQNCPNAVK